MPTVLITGLTGFIALHIAHRFLQANHLVRGTVRSSSKGDSVLSLPTFKQYAEKGLLSYVVVTDVMTGDHTEAMKDVDIVCHVASPVSMSNDQTWEEIKDPAVEGTRTVLSAAAKESSVKQVIQISSFAAMSDWLVPVANQVYSEETWNPITDEQAANLHNTLPYELKPYAGGILYCASKKFAELAAIDVHKKPGAKYRLARLCPPAVMGPTLDTRTALASQPHSMQNIMMLLRGKSSPVPSSVMYNYIDPRDFAEAIFRVAEQHFEGRLAISAGQFDNQLLADRIRELMPALDGRVPLGEPGKCPSVTGPRNTLDGSKAVRELRMTYRSLDETVLDAVECVLEMEKAQTA